MTMTLHFADLIVCRTCVQPFLLARNGDQSEVNVAVVIQGHDLSPCRTQFDSIAMPVIDGNVLGRGYDVELEKIRRL